MIPASSSVSKGSKIESLFFGFDGLRDHESDRVMVRGGVAVSVAIGVDLNGYVLDDRRGEDVINA